MPLIANRMEKRMTQRRVAIMVQDYLKAKVNRLEFQSTVSDMCTDVGK